MNRKLIASCIDHTLLKPNAGFSDINQLCREAHKFRFHSVCVNPWLVKEAAKNLKNSPVIICSVAGFSLGANTSKVKLKEIETCLKDGASEIDMVMNIGFFKDRKLKAVANEFEEAKKMTADAILKIIIETSLLSKDEIVTACKTVEASGADFVKTSTGFSGTGATVENIILIQNTLGSETLIKASGQINTLEHVQNMLDAGANRIGTSSSIIIMNEIPMT